MHEGLQQDQQVLRLHHIALVSSDLAFEVVADQDLADVDGQERCQLTLKDLIVDQHRRVRLPLDFVVLFDGSVSVGNLQGGKTDPR